MDDNGDDAAFVADDGLTIGAMSDRETTIHRLELLSVLVIAITSVLTAWIAFQATKWNTEMSITFNESNIAQTESVRNSNMAGRQLSVDVSLMTAFVEATAKGDSELAEFLRARFPDRLAVAVDAWLATEPLTSEDAPATPFDMDAYRLEAAEEAEILAAEADRLTEQAQEAGNRADRYTLTTVVLATAILMAALAVKMTAIHLQRAMLGLAFAILILTLLVTATFPVKL